MDCGGDDEEFGADIRSLCREVQISGCSPLELALSSRRMQRAGLWAIGHLGERDEPDGEYLQDVREFLIRAANDPELQDLVAVLSRRHPAFGVDGQRSHE